MKPKMDISAGLQFVVLYWKSFTHAEQHGIKWKTTFGATSEDSWRLSAESQPVKDTRGGEEERVTSREGGGEDSAVDNMRKA
jgi:hypothetical protein